MEKALLQVALSESEEEFMTAIIDDGIEQIISAQTTDYGIQDKLSAIITDLNALLKYNS